MKFLIYISVIITLFSCKKDEYINTIPNEVRREVETFISEGGNRGSNIELKGLKIVLSYNLPEGDAGYYNPNTHEVYFDTSSVKYKWSPESKERLVFHELAHALLKRTHREDFFSNNDPTSIMNPSTPWANWSGGLLYKRQYYLDELFNENTPAPLWSI